MINVDYEKVIKSSQEQGVAAAIDAFIQDKLAKLSVALSNQDLNLKNALKELDECKAFISGSILGSAKTKHGEIAEHVTVNFENARRFILGLAKSHTFEGVGRTAPEDYLRNGEKVQEKFYNGLRNTFFANHGILDHIKANPGFRNYDIPKDQYEEMVDILDKYHNNPSHLNKSAFNLAKDIDKVINENNFKVGDNLRPAPVDYASVQVHKVGETIKNEENNLKERNEEIKNELKEEAGPSIGEGLKVATISGVIEGGIAFGFAMHKKLKNKKLSHLTSEDWKEVGIESGKGAGIGFIRGGVVYTLTNYTNTPAGVASAYVTAAFGISAEIKQLYDGKISKEDFLINSQTICLDVSISAIAGVAGQTLIPIPVLGAIVGNATGQILYGICKSLGDEASVRIANEYLEELKHENAIADEERKKLIAKIQNEMTQFETLEEFMFSEEVNEAFDASIRLAQLAGVPNERILKNESEIDDFFLK